MRKIPFFVIGALVSGSRVPTASNRASLPWRATSSTAPGIVPFSTSALNLAVIRARRSADSPTCSGLTGARLWAWATATVKRLRTTSRVVIRVRIGSLRCVSRRLQGAKKLREGGFLRPGRDRKGVRWNWQDSSSTRRVRSNGSTPSVSSHHEVGDAKSHQSGRKHQLVSHAQRRRELVDEDDDAQEYRPPQ